MTTQHVCCEKDLLLSYIFTDHMSIIKIVTKYIKCCVVYFCVSALCLLFSSETTCPTSGT